MLAVHDGRPETMGLRSILSAHSAFLYDLNTRKYTNLLAREQERSEIQEGLIKATDLIDLIIETIRGSRDRATVVRCLTTGDTKGIKFRSKVSEKEASSFNFTEKQASAILDMRLAKLIGLELEALMKEHEETLKAIARYQNLLEKPSAMKKEICRELDDIASKYQDDRRTEITEAAAAVFTEKPVEEMDVYFVMDRFGYARVIDVPTFERNKEAAFQENRFVFKCKSTGKVVLFTNTGELHSIKVRDLPFGKFRDKGVPVDNVSNYRADSEYIVYAASQSDLNLYRLIFVTAKSMCKVVSGGEFDVSKRTVAATNLMEDDEVVSVIKFTDIKNIIFQTKNGFFLRFDPATIPEKKKTAVGVRGMKLAAGDVVENVYYTAFGEDLTITYHDKELELSKLKLGTRDSKGTKVRV